MSAENGGGVIRSGRIPRATETGAGEFWPARGKTTGFRDSEIPSRRAPLQQGKDNQ